MRAFLSTSDSHLRLPYPSDWLARYYGEQAVIEARRILAETEPRCDCAFDHLYGRCSGSAVDLDAVRAYVGEREALADALRAFVEGD